MAVTRIRKIMPARLRSAWPSDQLADGESPRALNVRFRFGEVRPAPGRSILAGPAAAENVLGLFRFPLSDGTEWIGQLTESKLLRWGNSNPGTPRQWHQVTGPGFLGGTRRWSAVAAEDRLLFARGNEPIMRWPAGSGTPVTGGYEAIPASVGTVPTARYLAYYNDRLIAMDTTEGGIRHANRLRYAVNANHTAWSGTGSGFFDFFDEREEPLLGGAVLSDRLVVYRQHSITDFVKTGVPLPVFTTQIRVSGRGLGAPHTLASNGQVHFFLGNDRRIYAWDGTGLTNIGEPIIEEVQALIDTSKMDTYFGTVATDRDEYWLCIGGSDVFVYDYLRGSWSRDSFPSLTALAEVEDARNVFNWAGAPMPMIGSWSQQTATWDDLKATEVTVLWAGRSTGATFTIDESTVYDYFAEGSIVDRNVETPDFYLGDLPDDMGTVQRIFLLYDFATSDPFEVGVSVDRGRSWTNSTLVPVERGYSYVDLQATGNTIRFRFREANAEGRFRWRSFSYEFVPAGKVAA